MRPLRFLLSILLFSLPIVLQAQREKLPPADLAIVEKTWPKAKRTATGLRTLVMVEGSGEHPKPGDTVAVTYTGKLIDGTVFDQALDPAKPFSFRLGRGHVIDGWEEGLQLMKVGEKRLLIVPYELGYGTRGDQPKIPRQATLIFEVELRSITKK